VTKVSIFTEDEIVPGSSMNLDRVHYLVNVMRLRTGDRVRIVNGRGKEFFGTITKIAKHRVEISNVECSREEEMGNFLGLIFPPLRRLEILVKMATELGVTSFLPFKAQHGQIRYNHGRIKKNIIESIEQSERLDFPDLANQRSLAELLDALDPAESVVLLCEERNPLNSRFPKLDKIRDKKIYAMIGPEGGFSEEEKRFIKSYSSVIPLSLGKTILRAETACASILTRLGYFQSCE
jgi:16S rRNA (uracil1498-N3)-methyltransferase